MIGTLPFLDAGTIIILFTVIVKIILLPLSIKASKAQLEMKNTEKDLALIKKQYGDNKEEFAKKQLEYYKEKGINPFAGIFIQLIQLPIIFALYKVFIKSGLPAINKEMLYPFILPPVSVNMVFLNIIDISHKSITLAVLAGITTYWQISLAAAPTSKDESTQSDMQKAMMMQMKYMFPVIMVVVAYSISSAVALYLITSNVFSVVHEMYIRKKYHKHALVV